MKHTKNRYTFLTMGKTYVMNSDTTLSFEMGDDGCKDAGWTAIKYDPYTGECFSLDGQLHYATIKLVEDDEDKCKG